MTSTTRASIIIPMLNEENHIVPCLQSLASGDYPADLLEFLVVDGGSTDRTLSILSEFMKANPQLKIHLFHNPNKTQGYALNVAIQNAAEDSSYIIRADAHSTYPSNFVAESIRTSIETNADNTGGAIVAIGITPLQKAIAYCMRHPFGVGDSRYRLGNFSGYVDTIGFGCYKKDVFKRVGLFDPLMTPNEDAEMNLRIRKGGGKVYVTSKMRIEYFPRKTIGDLARQYFKYGQSRCRTVKKHRAFTSIRQIIPPLWTLLTPLLVILGCQSSLFFMPILAYLCTALSISFFATIREQDVSILLTPVCFVLMHYSWGLGFLSELGKIPITSQS